MPYSDKSYEERLKALFIRFPSVQKAGFGSGAYKEGLDGMHRLDEVLGHPHRYFRCIHVAGTNGKGSVSSMLAASLAANGRKVGLYTSPHLTDFRERIKIVSGDSFIMIPKEDVWEFLEQFDSVLEGLSFFEITTGMCLWWFRKMDVDAAVIEVGLGGRLDSTNIIIPEVSVVTSIGLDHCALLGNTRPLIAAEKAGIFKRGVPAVVWGHDAETDAVFEREALEKGSLLHYAEPDSPEWAATCDLKGEYQPRNIATVLKALEVLGEEPDAPAICNTARITGLHGRWETLRRVPLTICDIGHNPAALSLNFKQLEEYGKPLTIVYGVMADKDLRSIIPLMPANARYIFCAPFTPRALSVEELSGTVRDMRPKLAFEKSESVVDAVRKAMETADPDSIIYIGGSAFVVAEAIRLFENTAMLTTFVPQ